MIGHSPAMSPVLWAPIAGFVVALLYAKEGAGFAASVFVCATVAAFIGLSVF